MPPSAVPASVAASASPSAPAKPPADKRTGRQLNKPYVVNGIPVISKAHRVSAQYRPPVQSGPNGLTPETARALQKMKAAAKADGIVIVVKSGFRTYATQKGQYQDALRTQPKNINFYAPPGASEHQSGLAVDLWDGKVWHRPMENTATGKWLQKHGHEYGFILRYPKGKTSITKIEYEPWHFRYIGVAQAAQFGTSNSLTLEEYLHLA